MRHVAIVAALCACIDTPPLQEPEVIATGSVVHERAEGLRPKLDLLIVLDTSTAMTVHGADLARLRTQLAVHLGSLTRQWTDLRVAVTGNGGTFQPLIGTSTTYLADAWKFDYTRERSYDGTLTAALTHLTRIEVPDGDLPRQLEAMRRALERNGLFARDDATLAILIVSASDDASPLPIEDYARWTDALAGAGSWLRRPLVVAGIRPAIAPRLEAFFTQSGGVQAVRAVTLDGDYADVIALLTPTRRGWWSFASPPCIDAGDLDPHTSTLEHDCTVEARVDAGPLYIPACTLPRDLAVAGELDTSSPAPACWQLERDERSCWPGSLAFALHGYTNLSHPAFRVECRSR